MIIKMLMENTTRDCRLRAEHGLSMYIEANGHKILFDSGQTCAFAQNASLMDVNLSEVDIAILSHGHYDHGGGLEHFLDANDSANLYINEHAFGVFYSHGDKPIGIPSSLKENERVVLTSDYRKLDEGLELYTCNTKERKYPTDSDDLLEKVDGVTDTDAFNHEQYLLITEHGKRVLISGCSHKGIQNIVEWFQSDVLIGGFHFKGIGMTEEGRRKLDAHSDKLQMYQTKYYTCHCTGVEQYEYLKERIGKQVEYLSAGSVIQI